jgi:hypothetical protein
VDYPFEPKKTQEILMIEKVFTGLTCFRGSVKARHLLNAGDCRFLSLAMFEHGQ